MTGSLKGLKDKLYWREGVPGSDHYHCFTRSEKGVYVSLCGRFEMKRSGGQGCQRPAVLKRCGLCDGREADRRGWDESGDPSPSPVKARNVSRCPRCRGMGVKHESAEHYSCPPCGITILEDGVGVLEKPWEWP